MGLNVGALVHEVTVQQLTEGVDNSGAPLDTWADLGSAWMRRDTEKAGEAFTAEQWAANVVTRWTTRYWAELDPDLLDVPKTRRLVYLGRVYDIMAAEVIDRKDGIVLKTLANMKVAA